MADNNNNEKDNKLAKPNSIQFRAHYVQKKRKKRKEAQE